MTSDVPVLDVPDQAGGPRVRLRLHHDDDLDRMVEQCTDPAVVEWTTVPLGYTRDDAARFARHIVPGMWREDVSAAFAVEVDGRYGGTVELRNHGLRGEVAYASHPDVRGTGVMERALRRLIEWGFAEKGYGSITWLANVGNEASRSLALRVGFTVLDEPLRAYIDHRGTLVDAWIGQLVKGDPLHR